MAQNQNCVLRYTIVKYYDFKLNSLSDLLILRIAWLTKSEYEFGHHTLFGLQVGLSKEEIVRITQDSTPSKWSYFDASLLQATDELHNNTFISDSTWNSLTERYNEKQMMDLSVNISLETYLTEQALNGLFLKIEEEEKLRY